MSGHAGPVHHAEAPKGFIRHYIFSLDHKIIGTQYILLGLSAVTIGVILSLIMRIHLVWPNAHIWGFANGIVSPEDYLRVVTMHGTLMVFRSEERRVGKGCRCGWGVVGLNRMGRGV